MHPKIALFRRAPAAAAAALLFLAAPGARAATFTVTNTDDSGEGSLRWAIGQANGAAGRDTIVFALGGPAAISPASELPALTDSAGVVIDGGGTVTLSGLSAPGGTIGIRIASDNNVIAGLRIVSFQSHGIRIEGDDNRVSDCEIGTDGAAALPNLGSGIRIESGARNHIGLHPEGGGGNLISGNNLDGIDAWESRRTVIHGNRIGTTAAGNAALPNLRRGVSFIGAGLRIGGPGPGEGNLISGNAQDEIYGTQQDLSVEPTVIQGNLIGLNAQGDGPVVSQGSGIALVASSNGVVIGGAGPGEGNTIGGHAQHGISAAGKNHLILGNRIGVAADGETPVPNFLNGINVNGQSMTIGGVAPGEGNIIAHNAVRGIQLSNSQFCAFRGNSIHDNGDVGIDMLPNSNEGIQPPEITGLAPVSGTTVPGGIVDFHADSGAQGRIHLGAAVADGSGAFSAPLDLAPHAGLNLTATVTGDSDNTSIFSAPVPIGGGAEGEADTHSADQNGDGLINLSELLRVIQFYNSPRFGCQGGTEDGFAPNALDEACAPHASDYNPRDWRIVLSELLRLIQFYNSGGYHPCGAGEDGFCPGPA